MSPWKRSDWPRICAATSGLARAASMLCIHRRCGNPPSGSAVIRCLRSSLACWLARQIAARNRSFLSVKDAWRGFMPSFPDNFLGACFPLLCLNPPTPRDLRRNHEIHARAKASVTFNCLCNAIDPDPPWLPGLNRLEIVNQQRHLRITCNYIFLLARGLKAVTSNVEARAIKLEAYGIHTGLPIGRNRANPGKGLRLQESPL